jgi:2-methylcitrate dehydratase PrpD
MTGLATGLTAGVAQFIHDKSLADFPDGAIDKAKKVIVDTVAVILSGADSEVAEPLHEYLRRSGELSGGGSTPILGTALRCSPETAALINGTYGHALDFDDVLSMMPAHPSAVIIPAVFAGVTHKTLTGKTLIEAQVMGIEVGGKIGLAITTEHYHRGFHGTGTLAMFCGVAALAKTHNLDVATTRIAFGIASSMASGIRRNFGTMTKPLHTGLAARNALQAVNLAMSGFTAAEDGLEGKAGFFASYGTKESDPQVALDGLGKPWIITDPGIALKRFPCCYASHRGIDGTLALKTKHGFKADDIARLECRMPEGGMEVLTFDNPQTGLEGKFSLQYSIAAAALDGHCGIWTFTDEAVRRAEIKALLKRTRAYETPECRGDDPLFDTRSSGSRGFVEVEIELNNGTKDGLRVPKPPGHPSRELTWDDLEAKFSDCAREAKIAETKAQQAFTALRNLEDCADLSTVIALLVH